MDVIEKTLASHSGKVSIVPDDILAVRSDSSIACDPTCSDLKYATNQHIYSHGNLS
jgi:hypothetical protein